ncbi:MAG: hypothetical protein ACTSQ0_05365 [Candidatus Heimdallarchaeota archaeon]
MITTNLLSIIVNALDVPDAFSGIFATFWVFLIVTVVVALLITVVTIVVFVLIIRAVIKRNKASEDTFEQNYAEASKETEPIKCEFCGKTMKHGTEECPNCGAQVWTN